MFKFGYFLNKVKWWNLSTFILSNSCHMLTLVFCLHYSWKVFFSVSVNKEFENLFRLNTMLVMWKSNRFCVTKVRDLRKFIRIQNNKIIYHKLGNNFKNRDHSRICTVKLYNNINLSLLITKWRSDPNSIVDTFFDWNIVDRSIIMLS